MKKEDLTKFFFGFGDINTMTYFSNSLGRASYQYETIFNSKEADLSSGVYFCKLTFECTAKHNVQIKKMTLLK